MTNQRQNDQEILARLSMLESNMDQLKNDVEETRGLAKQVQSDTAALVEWTVASQGAFKVLVGLAKIAKIVTAISVAITTLVAVWHSWGDK